ncbi:hypothetical protein G6F62_008993 [Rhizopus arrhizus]|nr:hypothetical protein G6F35_005845 [Rhizopus arrhizus]KAG1324620.1 hypothetical protein G6F62_008993 [Rhizopus arrhizus]
MNVSQLTFQQANKCKGYIKKRNRKISSGKEKEHEEATRKAYKTKLSEANLNYINFRNRDIVKLQKAYTHKCEELKNAQHTYQLQQQHYEESNNNDEHSIKSSRNSADITRLSGDYSMMDDQHNKKGMAGLFSQMRTIAASNGYLSPVDQNKQISKFAKMKKDITDADSEYRDGILILETLRKKQRKMVEETNWQVKNTIKRKAECVKSSLLNIVLTEMECLRVETEKTTASYTAAMKVDSNKDIQVYTIHHQSLGYHPPAPIRYENFYLEGKCREVLFGGSLESYAIEHNRPVPVLVIKCIEAIEGMGGLQKEGIYRVSGRQSNVEQLKHQFELDEDQVILDNRHDVFTIATILKMYIRELKRPLLDFNVQSRLSYSKHMPQVQRFGMLESKLSNLSFAHRSTLHCLVSHLANVNSNSQINKMNIQNLALIFTPVIFHDFNQTEETTTGDWSPEDLFEDMILHHERLFPISEENARKMNEAKLQKALQGESPYSQFSQSNLLYINYPQPPPKNMLLTQSMNPPLLTNDPNRYSDNYPPKLTTIIGTSTANYQQQLAILNTSDSQQEHPLNQAPVENNTPSFGRSVSDTIILQRGASLKNKPVPSRTSSVRRVSNPIMMPPRRDSLRKPKEDNTMNHSQYQPELAIENTLPTLNEKE